MIKVIDTRKDFGIFLAHKEHMNKLDAYKKYYYEPNKDILDGLAMTHIYTGISGLDATVSSLDFKSYEDQYKKLSNKDFIDLTQKILEKAEKMFSISENTLIECYLVFGYNTMTGCSTCVNNKFVLAIGLEQVANYPNVSKYEDLLLHEFYHVIRVNKKEILEEMTGTKLENTFVSKEILDLFNNTKLKFNLIEEGLAVVAPSIIKGEKITADRLRELLFYKKEQYEEISRRSAELWRNLKSELESKDIETTYKWAISGSHVQKYGIPERSLYYLGAKLILDLIEKENISFSQLTDMTSEEILKKSGIY
ncbi:hypothetical protein G9F72_005970 [Clostridium estertheticum]|uniref:hypothetical protein n=1 Tax=Clostridium estertheticum TaxID=238834 RepID=UPI0013E97C51|nr:hypothetical protein [Clostridium estertheticum]MBZ9685888.1 hypothetical protein [Clostridium estertheticum]